MIRRKDEMRLQVRDNIRGGSGRIENLHIFEPEELEGKCTLCSVFELDPGDSIGGHAHEADGEIYYVLRGELVVTEDGTEHVLYAGDASYTCGGSSHAIENRSGEKASFMAIILP